MLKTNVCLACGITIFICNICCWTKSL